MLKHLIRYLVLGLWGFLTLSSCALNRVPDWVNKRPQTPEYYYSIVKISPSHTNYKETARERAMQDIAMQIVVQVRGQIESSETEISGVASSVFESMIQSSTSAQLTDIELYSVYENSQDYYAWYRVNKARYKAMRETRKNLALEQALDILSRSDAPGSELQLRIGNLLGGLDLLDEYIDLNLNALHQGKTIHVYNELLARLRALPALVEIRLDPAGLEAVAYQKTATTVTALVSSRGVASPAFPLKVSMNNPANIYSAETSTHAQGKLLIRLEQICGFERLQELKIQVDKAQFRQQIKSPAVAQIWDGIVFNPARLLLRIRRPKIWLEYSADGKPDPEGYSQVSGRLVEFEISMAETADNADYSLRIDVLSRDGQYIPEIGVQSALSSPSLSLMNNATGEILYSETIPNIKGTGKTQELARMRARQNVAEYLCNEVIYNAVATKIYP